MIQIKYLKLGANELVALEFEFNELGLLLFVMRLLLVVLLLLKLLFKSSLFMLDSSPSSCNKAAFDCLKKF